MKIIKKFSEFNNNEFLFESIQIPKKRFPTDKVLNIIDVKNYIEKKYDIKFTDLSGDKSGGFHSRNFFTGYESKMLLKTNPNAIVYPEFTTLDQIKKEHGKESPYYDARYESYIDNDSIVEIPKEHDTSLDDDIYNKKKKNFIETMRKLRGKDISTDGINFGPKSFDWVNKALELIHKEFSQYYKGNNINLWHPKGWNEASWGHTNPDYPHKYYNYNGELAHHRKNGVYFLSDIEKYIDNKYGIGDDNFYNWIIANDYIEGRYWENIVSISFEEGGKLTRGGGQYGMKTSENIEHILNILEKDFDLLKSDDDGFEIYIDYYKKLPSKF